MKFSDELDTVQFALEKPNQLEKGLIDDLKLAHLDEKEREYIIEMNRNLSLCQIILNRILDRCETDEQRQVVLDIMESKKKDYLREVNLIGVTRVNRKSNHALNLLFGHVNKKEEEEQEDDLVKGLIKKMRKRKGRVNEDDDED